MQAVQLTYSETIVIKTVVHHRITNKPFIAGQDDRDVYPIQLFQGTLSSFEHWYHQNQCQCDYCRECYLQPQREASTIRILETAASATPETDTEEGEREHFIPTPCNIEWLATHEHIQQLVP